MSAETISLLQGVGMDTRMSFQQKARYNGLFWLHLLALVLHLAQFVATLTLASMGIFHYSSPIFYTHTTSNPEPMSYVNARGLVRTRSVLGHTHVEFLMPVFFGITACAHLFVLLLFSEYRLWVSKGTNLIRWTEYTLSASVMSVAIVILVGSDTLGEWIGVGFLTGITMLTGFLVEADALGRDWKFSFQWMALGLGSICNLGAWTITFVYYIADAQNIPAFVHAIVWVLLAFYASFAITAVCKLMEMQHAANPRRSPSPQQRIADVERISIKYEKVYLVLSFSSKTALAWIVFGGTWTKS